MAAIGSQTKGAIGFHIFAAQSETTEPAGIGLPNARSSPGAITIFPTE
jgi:hypothetical protein